jgi:hypothetical protein
MDSDRAMRLPKVLPTRSVLFVRIFGGSALMCATCTTVSETKRVVESMV